MATFMVGVSSSCTGKDEHFIREALNMPPGQYNQVTSMIFSTN